jgi:hypothetical protein
MNLTEATEKLQDRPRMLAVLMAVRRLHRLNGS